MLLCDAINKCRENPPSNWPKSAYDLIMREDLASQNLTTFVTINEKKKTINVEKLIDWSETSEVESSVVKDGMENLDTDVKKKLAFTYKFKN